MIVQITVLENDILYFRFENDDSMLFKCTSKIGEALKTIEDLLIRKEKEWGEETAKVLSKV